LIEDTPSPQTWPERLRTFRQRNGLKQEAAASLLGVSQAYISRVENGTVTPSRSLIQRLDLLYRQPEHRPVIDLMKTAIRHSLALCCLWVRESEEIVIEEHSRTFFGAGHPFDKHQRGGLMRWDMLGPEAHAALGALNSAGAFDGRVGCMEVVWTTPPWGEHAPRHFRTIISPVRGDDARWRLHASTLEIGPRDKDLALRRWGGPVRLFDYDEEPPFEWP